MLLIATSMIGGFIFAALLTDGNVDDDDNGRSGATWRGSLCSSPLLVTSLSFEVSSNLFIFNTGLIILENS